MTYLPGVRANKTVAIAAADVNKISDVGSLATMFNDKLTIDFSASIFDSANLTATKGALIFDHASLTVAKAASIFDSANLTATKGALIFDHASLTVAKAASIFDSANLTATKGALIFDHASLTVAKAASIFDSANLTISRINAIIAEINLSAEKAQTILKDTNVTSSKLIDIITDTASDVTISTNTEISATNRYKSLTINADITLTIVGQPGILICGTLTNNGTITKSVTGSAGGAAVNGSGAGGIGGGGLQIFTKTFVNTNLINSPANNGSNGGANTPYGSSANGLPGSNYSAYRISTDTTGLAGRGGNTPRASAETGGAGGSPTYTTQIASQLFTTIRNASIYWYLVNIMSKTPSTSYSFLNVGGSGGGSGCAVSDTTNTGGGGGGVGGEIIIACDSFNNSGTIASIGGTGGEQYGTQGGNGIAGGNGIIYGLYDITLIAAGTLTGTTGKTLEV